MDLEEMRNFDGVTNATILSNLHDNRIECLVIFRAILITYVKDRNTYRYLLFLVSQKLEMFVITSQDFQVKMKSFLFLNFLQ